MSQEKNILYLIIVGLLLGFFIAFPISWCWNYVMPYLFGLPEINWKQAWCIYFLSSQLFKNIPIKK